MKKLVKVERKKLILRKICWKIHDFMRWIRENFFCDYNLDIQSIKQEVETIDNKAKGYEKVEEYLPQIQQTVYDLEECKNENERAENAIEKLNFYVQELYIAELNNDSKKKKEIFDFLISVEFIKV